MTLILLFTLFVNVFGQSKLRGTVDPSLVDDEVFHWKEFNNFQERFRPSESAAILENQLPDEIPSC